MKLCRPNFYILQLKTNTIQRLHNYTKESSGYIVTQPSKQALHRQ
jgi:hypothetical protein